MNNLTPLPDRIKYFKDKYLNSGKWPDHIGFSIATLKTIEAGEQALFLGQFIPYKDGKPLEKPNQYDYYGKGETSAIDSIESYNKALEEFEQVEQKVLFKGWECHSKSPHITWIGINELIFVFKSTGSIYIEEPSYKTLTTIEDIAHLRPLLTENGKKEFL